MPTASAALLMLLTLVENIIDVLFSALLDGYNTHQLPRKSRFPRSNPLSIHLLRSVMVYDVRRALDSGTIVPVQFGNNPNDWCDSMEQDGTYIDLTFMEMSAQVLDSDIVIVIVIVIAGSKITNKT